MYKSILAGLVVLAIAVAVLVWKPTISEIEPPAATDFSKDDIDRGRVLAGIGNCMACHTADPQRPYAGGVSIPTPFGTLYSTNITPHPAAGIGRWSLEAFVRAMRQGVSRDGSHLYPAFPYTHYTRLTDADLSALYAYFMTREPVAEPVPANELGFPYNQRLLLAGWKLLFLERGRWQPRADRDEQWNRGEYLAQGLGHCSACHTPRNRFGAERTSAAYTGAVVDNWYAPNLTAGQQVPAAWSEDELYRYLREGGSPLHGVAVGSMAEVVHLGLDRASDTDVRALAVYFADMAAADGADPDEQAAEAIRAARQRAAGNRSHGEHLYAAACAPCHFNPPQDPAALRPELSLNSAVSAPDPINLLRVTLEGVSDRASGLDGAVMPAFGDSLSDADLIDLATYLRSTHSSQPPWENLSERLADLRRTAR